MTATLAPADVGELVEAVRSAPQVLAVGGGTKPRLTSADCEKVSMTHLRGIVEYDPAEFTFTALAGTPVKEIVAALGEKGQHLPFDPMWMEAGATLGGTVASGVSGPGRFRFGGLRDFILAVRFVDGRGRLLRMGSKVVKNAAGFDLPKFFVGSLGRFGILAEITFKVFPRPASMLTVRLSVKDTEHAAQIVVEAAGARWELQALDIPAGGEAVCLRLGGPMAAIEAIAKEILARWRGEVLANEKADLFWGDVREFRWAHPEGLLVKVALTPDLISPMDNAVRQIKGSKIHYSSGGNVAFVSLPDAAGGGALDERLRGLRLTGLALRGDGPLWFGEERDAKILHAVKNALDPDNRFPSLEE